MLWKNTERRWGAVAKSFHWITALLVIGMLCAGLYMTGLENSPQKFQIYGLHKSIGVTILLIVVLRILWKSVTVRPEELATHKKWERALARLVHFFLYFAILTMPLSGWAMSSAKNFPVSVFGLFTLPNIVGPNPGLAGLLAEYHEILAWALMGAIGLHFAGAIKHHIIDRDETLRRMLPLAAVLIVFAGTQTARAQDAARWTVVPENSLISFTATQMGAEFSGRFAKFSGEILFDPAKLDASRVDMTVDIASADTQSPERDQQIGDKDWFDAKAFPQARFVSESFASDGGNKYRVKGNLTIRDITLPVEIPFTLDIVKNGQGTEEAVARGTFSLQRLDYHVGQGQWTDTKTVGNDVSASFDITAVK